MRVCDPYSVSITAMEPIAREADDALFLHHARSCAEDPFSAVLLSGGSPPRDGENRYSMAFRDPFAFFFSKGSQCRVRTPDREITFEATPLEAMDLVQKAFHPSFPLSTGPFSGGAVGYFAYDLKNTIERLPQSAQDDLQLPDIMLFWPSQILIHDRIERQLVALTLEFQNLKTGTKHGGQNSTRPKALQTGRAFWQPCGPEPTEPFKIGELKSNFQHHAYLDAVRNIRHYIRQGDVYQVNLSQRYGFPFQGSAFHLWESLFQMNPAPFYAYVHAGDHRILSTSMERFLFQQGRSIETRPIKGTRKRGLTPEEDEALCKDLVSSVKDDAELSMIVDLLRNDLGRVCAPGSVRVTQHKRLESYQNVHHLVSIVVGELKPDTTRGQLLAATFPGGSITGCPKIRAMEIIDELEPNVRHIYTGAIGYLGWHENLDLNIAIRTALVHGSSCYFSVGGGVVYDSSEEEEYQETLHKGRTLFQFIEKLGASSP